MQDLANTIDAIETYRTLEFILYWVMFSIAVAWWIRARSDEVGAGIAFFFISLFLSPVVGFLTGLIVPNIPKGKQCDRCSERVHFRALVCRYCGNEFPVESPNTSSDDVKPQPAYDEKKKRKRADEVSEQLRRYKFGQ